MNDEQKNKLEETKMTTIKTYDYRLVSFVAAKIEGFRFGVVPQEDGRMIFVMLETEEVRSAIDDFGKDAKVGIKSYLAAEDVTKDRMMSMKRALKFGRSLPSK